jgi:hypothetical protein
VVECTSRSVVATTFTRGNFATTLSIIPKNAPGSSLDFAATSGPGMPRPFCRSSSLPTSTSTFSTIFAITATARSAPPETFQSFSRKLRSNEQTAPAALAARIPSAISSAVVGESAAKMPPLWNQRTPPWKIAGQSKSPGLSSAAASFARL